MAHCTSQIDEKLEHVVEWQLVEKPKYCEKTSSTATLSTINIWYDLGLSPGWCGQKLAIDWWTEVNGFLEPWCQKYYIKILSDREKSHIYKISKNNIYEWQTSWYSEHCRKWTPVSSTHTLPPYIKTEPIRETTRTATHSTRERNQHTKKSNITITEIE